MILFDLYLLLTRCFADVCRKHAKLQTNLFKGKLFLYIDLCSQDKLASRNSKVKSLVCLKQTTAASGKGSGFDNRMFSFVVNLLSQSSADGSLPLLACAVDPEAQSGDFYIPGKEGLGSRLMQVWTKVLKLHDRQGNGTLHDAL
jgi:hypothetical protein